MTTGPELYTGLQAVAAGEADGYFYMGKAITSADETMTRVLFNVDIVEVGADRPPSPYDDPNNAIRVAFDVELGGLMSPEHAQSVIDRISVSRGAGQ